MRQNLFRIFGYSLAQFCTSPNRSLCVIQKEQTRIADDVRLVWGVHEKKTVSVTQLGW